MLNAPQRPATLDPASEFAVCKQMFVHYLEPLKFEKVKLNKNVE